MKRPWIVPLVFLVVLLAAWPLRWEKSTELVLQREAACLQYMRDRWTGCNWVRVYYHGKVETVPASNTKPRRVALGIKSQARENLAQLSYLSKRLEELNQVEGAQREALARELSPLIEHWCGRNPIADLKEYEREVEEYPSEVAKYKVEMRAYELKRRELERQAQGWYEEMIAGSSMKLPPVRPLPPSYSHYVILYRSGISKQISEIKTSPSSYLIYMTITPYHLRNIATAVWALAVCMLGMWTWLSYRKASSSQIDKFHIPENSGTPPSVATPPKS